MKHRDNIGPWLAKKAMLHRLGVKDDEIVVFDIGAHTGDITKYYMRMWPSAWYYCFEPEPSVYDVLVQNLKKYDRVTTESKAIASRSDLMSVLHVGVDREMSSLLPRSGLRRYYRHTLDEEVDVSVVSLDTYTRRRGIEHIHVIKCDTQGSEMLVLRGARRLLREHKIDILYMEAFFIEMYSGAPLCWQLSEFLSKYDYTVFDIYNLGRSKVSRQLKYGDAMWISPRIREEVLDVLPAEWLGKSLDQSLESIDWGQ